MNGGGPNSLSLVLGGEGWGEGLLVFVQCWTLEVGRSMFEFFIRTSNVQHWTSNVERRAPHPNPLPRVRSRRSKEDSSTINASNSMIEEMTTCTGATSSPQTQSHTA